MAHNPKTLADIIRHAESFGDRPFFAFVPAGVDAPGERCTFADFVDGALRLATELESKGVGPGARLALIGRPDRDYGEVLAAGLLLGAAVLPVNSLFKEREIAAYLRSVGCTHLYADGSTLDRASAAMTGCPILSFEDHPDAEPLQRSRARLAPRPIDPTVPGIVLHTSGTTGLPKGADHAHHDHVAFLAQWRSWGPAPDDRIISFSPLYHQAGLFMQFFAALNIGAPLTQLESFSARTFWRLVDGTDSTACVLIPPVPSYLLAAPPSENDRAHSLKWAFVAGRSDHWKAFQDRFGIAGHSGYASTEITVLAITGDRASGPCADARLRESGYLCGRVVEGWADLRIVDDQGQPVLQGQSGHIEVKGKALFRGYLDNLEMSQKAFNAEGWFQTGDTGYLSAAGDLYLVDRTKDLIRRSQEKIAPGEIESALMDHPDIAEAAVVGVPDPLREQEIRACIVLKPGSTLSADAIFDHCRTLLADFKVPRYLDFRAALPRTATSKVRRDELIAQSDPAQWIDRERRGKDER